MLTFLLYTVVFWLANAAFARIAYVLIQPGQIFGFWQNVLNWMNDSDSKLLHFLYKPLGGCEFCFAHFITMCFFVGYVIFCRYALNLWITDRINIREIAVLVNIGWYFIYASIGTVAATFAITRLKK